MSTTRTYPKISIVTPTYNSADFLEATIQSLLSQNYPELEYIIIDGGSTDGTLEIIEKYQEHLAYWISEPDKGMYDAIQKGFEQSTGEIMGWLNSDDLYFQWTLDVVARVFTEIRETDWITSNLMFGIDADGTPLYTSRVPGYSRDGYIAGEHTPSASRTFTIEYIGQESTFWRRSLWEKSGASLDTSLKYAGDAELWFRFYDHATLYDVSSPLGQFRVHDAQITSRLRDDYEAEVEALMQRYQAVPHKRFSAGMRQFARKYTPRRGRRILHSIGLLYLSHRIHYHTGNRVWQIRKNYY